MKTITVNDFVLFRLDCHTGEEPEEEGPLGGSPESPPQKTVARDKFYISDNRFDPGRAEAVDEASSEARVRGLAREIAAITGGRCGSPSSPGWSGRRTRSRDSAHTTRCGAPAA